MDFNFVFMPNAQAALRRERGLGPEDPLLLKFHSAGWPDTPIAGDLFSDPRVSRRLFVVVSRMFMWNESAQAYMVQLLLDVAPNSEVAPQIVAVLTADVPDPAAP